MTAAASVTLDVCTPEGSTWLAQLTGLNPKYTFEREFINAASNNLSNSGKTGTKTFYLVEDGIYQSREGRRSLRHTDGRDGQGNRFYRVAGGEATTITLHEAIAAVRDGAA